MTSLRRALWLLPLIWALLGPSVAWGSDPVSVEAASETPETDDESSAPPRECPVVCDQHEACVQQRCVPLCRPACRRGTFCSPSGECEPFPLPKEPVLTESDRQRISGAASAESRGFAFLDVGGIIGFGARLGVDMGQRDSFIMRATLSNTGILSHAEYVENEQQRFEWGFGASVGYRRYESTIGNLRGFYFGGGLSYSTVLLRRRGPLDIAQLQHTAAPYAEFGYRWVFGWFAIGFGPSLALRYPVASTIVGSDRDRCGSTLSCDEARGRRFEGSMNLELGWFL